jgi:hypothetical protein
MHNRLGVFVLWGVSTVLVAPVGSTTAADPEAAQHESMSHWQWFMDLAVPKDAGGRFDCVLTPAILDKASEDLPDLRIIDGKDREIPYALRVRRSQTAPEAIPATEFNKSSAANPDGSVEVSFDLGAAPVEHRSLTVEPDGAAYRRRAQVQGSDNANGPWQTLLDDGELVSLRVGSQAIDARTLTYPASRFRYVRVRVFADKAGGDHPNAPRVQVWKSVETEGEDVTFPVDVSPREPIPTSEGPGSVWYLSVHGAGGALLNTYWERLSFEVANPEFSRSFYVEAADPGTQPRRLTREEGRWVRAPGETAPLTAAFPEVRSRRLRLVVVDNRDPPLRLLGAHGMSAARELVFTPGDWAPPLRLYFGNPAAEAGRYNDYVARLPVMLKPSPQRIPLGEGGEFADPQKNPEYVTPPLPFTERFPWLIYVVISLAGLTLLGILLFLARRAVARHDAKPAPLPAAGAG